MAKQKGILPIQGTIGNLNFFKGADGEYRVRQKSSIDKTRIKTDEAFVRTREHLAEFATAAKGSKLLRDALSILLKRIGDKDATKRLTSSMFKALKADVTSPRGSRNLMDGDITMLKGFEFSNIGKVNTTFTGAFSPVVDRVNGTLGITIPQFVPSNVVVSSEASTHFQLHVVGVELNFGSGNSVADIESTAVLPINGTPVPSLILETQVSANSTNPLILLLAVELWQESNGRFYPLNNQVYNGMVVVEASKV